MYLTCNKKLITLLSTLALSVSLSACQSPQLNASIAPGSFVNPNIHNQASPVVISIFQLKSPDKFNQAPYLSLLNDPAKTLAGDLIDKREIEVRPEKNEKLNMTILPNATYIGVTGAFRNASTTIWRKIVPIKSSRSLSLQINVNTQGIDIQTPKQGIPWLW